MYQFHTPFRRKNAQSFLWIVTLSLLPLAACTPPPKFVDNLNQYKTVAVISLLPQTITMSHIGITIFQNDFAIFPLDWNPNTVATQTAIALLNQNYQVKDLHVDTNAFVEAIQKKYSKFDIGATEDLVIDQLKATVKPGQVDLIIVIDASAPESIRQIGPDNSGVGLVSTSGHDRYGIGSDTDVIHTNAVLEVLDGTTFDHIVVNMGSAYPDIASGNAPDASVSGLSWRGQAYSDLSLSQKQQLTSLEQQVVRNFVTVALKNVHLIND